MFRAFSERIRGISSIIVEIQNFAPTKVEKVFSHFSMYDPNVYSDDFISFSN